MENGVVLCGLALLAADDIRRRQINVIFLLALSIFIFLCHLILGSRSLFDIAAGASVGAFLLLLSAVTKGRIGVGDGLLFLLVIGPAAGFVATLQVLFLATLLSGLSAALLLAGRRILKKEQAEEVPFVPFVLAAFIAVVIFGGMR